MVWPECRIAWEVDLTMQTRGAQEERARIRRDAGYRMISIVDSGQQKESLLGVETLAVYGLAKTGRAQADAEYPVEELFVTSANELALDGSLRWQEKRKYRVIAFCRDLLNGRNPADSGKPKKIRYCLTPDPGWYDEDEIKTFELLSKEAAKKREAVKAQRLRSDTEFDILQLTAKISDAKRDAEEAEGDAQRLRAASLSTRAKRRKVLGGRWSTEDSYARVRYVFDALRRQCAELDDHWLLAFFGLASKLTRDVETAKEDTLKEIQDVANGARARETESRLELERLTKVLATLKP